MYIRTKDGVYKVSHYNAYATHKRKGETLLEGYKTSYIKNENIISQSDTIEELCDEFVYIENGKPRVLDRVITRTLKEKGIKYAEKIYSQPNWNGLMFGAIWTDKGLIYVAKMNDKGELELI